MAKLSARGRKEVIRLTRQRETPDDPLITKEQTVIALMTDGAILHKRTVWFREEAMYGREKSQSYGWKKVTKPKKEFLGPDGKVSVAKLRAHFVALGYGAKEGGA